MTFVIGAQTFKAVARVIEFDGIIDYQIWSSSINDYSQHLMIITNRPLTNIAKICLLHMFKYTEVFYVKITFCRCKRKHSPPVRVVRKFDDGGGTEVSVDAFPTGREGDPGMIQLYVAPSWGDEATITIGTNMAADVGRALLDLSEIAKTFTTDGFQRRVR